VSVVTWQRGPVGGPHRKYSTSNVDDHIHVVVFEGPATIQRLSVLSLPFDDTASRSKAIALEFIYEHSIASRAM
jgi:hypothetical protein